MTVDDVESAVKAVLAAQPNGETFIVELLAAYGHPKASITRLRSGDYNLSKANGELLWKKNVFYRYEPEADLHATIEALATDPRTARHKPRFVLATDLETLLAKDTKTNDTLDVPLSDLPRHFDFFLPWAGMEKAQHRRENPADIKAAEKMGRLYDLIVQDNDFSTEEQRHGLNVFLTRLLFCFFAEDTGIFPAGQFTNAVASHTSSTGEDLQGYLTRLFEALNREHKTGLPHFLQGFPYVNGGLFAHEAPVPEFSAKSRRMIIEVGELDWKSINPDILGSMMQAVVHGEKRDGLGMHYTSVTNILKVLEPLFLDDLREQLEQAGESKPRLQKLLERLYGIRVLDPACGSGNFLVIAYKELARIEIDALRRIHGSQVTARFTSRLVTSQFYGIEIDDFAHETAKLSLWLAEHQMNVEFRDVFGTTRPTLPLKDGGNVVLGNAAKLDWNGVCPTDQFEIYVLGNPPYVGFAERSPSQRDDMDHVFQGMDGVKRLDYVACWFKKATDFILGARNAAFAFVTTNSLCQGEQVSLLWPYVFEKGLAIQFAHRDFKWSNNAKGKAGVTCHIVGVARNATGRGKWLFTASSKQNVSNISPYLIEGASLVMHQRSQPVADLAPMALGSTSLDGGHLILSGAERKALLGQAPNAEQFLRPFLGGEDFLDGIERYCLWIEDHEAVQALKIPGIAARVAACQEFREKGGRDARTAADTPHRFKYRKFKHGDGIVLPMTSSESREYLPVGWVKAGTVASHGVFVVYGADPFLFGVVSSRMHLLWVRLLSGKLESRIRYSVNLNYNTFPLPAVSPSLRDEVTSKALAVLDERERHSDLTLSQLYDRRVTPTGLRQAHLALDSAVERCFRKRPFLDDDERLAFMFARYELLTSESQQPCLIS